MCNLGFITCPDLPNPPTSKLSHSTVFSISVNSITTQTRNFWVSLLPISNRTPNIVNGIDKCILCLWSFFSLHFYCLNSSPHILSGHCKMKYMFMWSHHPTYVFAFFFSGIVIKNMLELTIGLDVFPSLSFIYNL